MHRFEIMQVALSTFAHGSLALALALTGACAVEVGGDDVPELEIGTDHVTASEHEQVEPSICDLLPAEGSCSLLCKPAELGELLPENTCAVFACTLTDGTDVHVHVCHPR